MKNTNDRRKTPKVRTLTQLALLTAVVLVMAATPLGYLRVGPLTMSLLTVPVAIGAMLSGPTGGAWMGFVFGMTSFGNAVNGTGGLTAFAFQYNPVLCFLTCVGTRVACGLCCALLFRAAERLLPARPKTACLIGALSAPILNTVFFMGCLLLFFYNLDQIQNLITTFGVSNPVALAASMVGLQGLIETAVCGGGGHGGHGAAAQNIEDPVKQCPPARR